MAEPHATNVMFLTYDLERGGSELRLLDLATHCPADFRMFICVTSPNVSLLESFERTGVEVEIVPIRRAYTEVAQVRRVLESVKRNHIGIINTFDVKGLVVAVRIKFMTGRRVKVIHHVVNLLHDCGPRRRLALRLLLAGADGVISNSRAAKDLLESLHVPEAKIEVVHNGVDASAFSGASAASSSLRRALGIPEEAHVIGTVANLRKEKEYPFLLEAFARLSPAFPRLRLLCVGGGPLLEETKRLAATRGVADRTRFTGYVPNVADYLAIMDVFVLTSSKESFPNAVLQAMSMEVPVVASAVGGCLEIIEHDTDGLLFVPGDVDGFVEGVSRMLGDATFASALALSGKRKVWTTFSLTTMIDHYFDYFRRVTGARRAEKAP